MQSLALGLSVGSWRMILIAIAAALVAYMALAYWVLPRLWRHYEHQRGLAGNLHRLGDLAYLQLHVYPSVSAYGQLDPAAHKGLEPGHGGLHLVAARNQLRHDVAPLRVRLHGPRNARGHVPDLYGGTGNDGARYIPYRPRYRGRGLLGCRETTKS